MRCACHLLHNVVEVGFKRATKDDPSFETREPCLRALTKTKAFVAHIHNSWKASERFNAEQCLVLEELRYQEAVRAGPSGGRQAIAGVLNDEWDSKESMEAAELEPGVAGFDPQHVPSPKRVYRLVSQVDTRWNSRCYMMERWVHMRTANMHTLCSLRILHVQVV